MAFTPCAAHGGKYSGGANTFFLRLTRGNEQHGGRLQMCANCATITMDYLQTHFLKVSEGETFLEWTEPVACLNCGGDLGNGSMAFYGNAYPRGRAETQWFGRVCERCLSAVAEDLHLDKAEQRT